MKTINHIIAILILSLFIVSCASEGDGAGGITPISLGSNNGVDLDDTEKTGVIYLLIEDNAERFTCEAVENIQVRMYLKSDAEKTIIDQATISRYNSNGLYYTFNLTSTLTADSYIVEYSSPDIQSNLVYQVDITSSEIENEYYKALTTNACSLVSVDDSFE
ncbi:hypothetical protein KMW28_12130 [Flammeovirga yaeyamensis]|uniref:Lipoprotein n=1 Tax=Flammeovirga yaeyamensis TaxID=367791 RepID=A0AAX1N204_9BACT|nr:hypothetical protein [Flammeovirga yaeyamensis]MBB3696086.1 hypothetical protein [Flammeovirga yaeyamensis]NMF34771.1 hypothetical protein [Flammeovirga yaeyamensis]QWG00401.1 hypothetical protein KMW28_12130 [Flammeovirga yaeyamensis]